MDRRAALERIAWMMGGVLSASTIAGVMNGCSAGEKGTIFTPRTLTGDRLECVATIADHIIPQTDTPGAREAGVHEFIDNMLTDHFDVEEKQRFMDGLSELEARSYADFRSQFAALEAADQVELLTVLEAEGVPFFATIKALSLTGYYTSEVGAMQELHLAPYGSYKADVPFAQIGRTWA